MSYHKLNEGGKLVLTHGEDYKIKQTDKLDMSSHNSFKFLIQQNQQMRKESVYWWLLRVFLIPNSTFLTNVDQKIHRICFFVC